MDVFFSFREKEPAQVLGAGGGKEGAPYQPESARATTSGIWGSRSQVTSPAACTIFGPF